MSNLAACIERGTSAVREDLATVAEHAEQLRAIQDTLDPTTDPSATRRRRFSALAARLSTSPDPIQQHMATNHEIVQVGTVRGR